MSRRDSQLIKQREAWRLNLYYLFFTYSLTLLIYNYGLAHPYSHLLSAPLACSNAIFVHGQGFFYGLIDDFRVYSLALAANQVLHRLILGG